MKFIRNIEVKYDVNEGMAPINRVRELSNQSDNINHQFGGSYVWLVPVYTEGGRGAALTGFHVSVQPEVDNSVSDLAQGAGGSHRYLLFNMDAMRTDKVTEVALYRSLSPMTGLPDGWMKSTTNINEGRAGTCLYLLWKTA